MKEILSINVGQAGVQMGNAIWELLCAEHGINESGFIQEPSQEKECLDTFFTASNSCRLIPRCIFVDLEPSVIDEVKHGSFKNLFHPDRLITGPEDAASNFARGFFTVGKLLLGIVSHEIKRLLESADNTQAIMIFRSLGGGTGSGLTSAIFDCLADYPKLVKIEIPIYPSPTLSTAMVEPYNCLLGEHFCMEDIDVGLLFDNEALYDVCSKYLSLSHPTYCTINRLISQVISSVTASVRFESVMNCDITVLQTNLVPYPRIHFPLANYAPILSTAKGIHEELTVMDLTRTVFEKENQMMKVDHSFGRFMSCSLLYRGEVSPYNVYIALNNIKKDKNIEFVEWCPTGFKVGINVCPPTIIPASEMYPTTKNVAMLANTSAIGQAWQRLTHKFYLLYSKRSFVHWFVGEGMEECEFTESLYNISALVKDYEEVTMDRNFEEETGAMDSPAEDTEEVKVGQSNTAFTENVKKDEISEEESEVKKTMKNEENFADEHVINEEEENNEEADEAVEENEVENTVENIVENTIENTEGGKKEDEEDNVAEESAGEENVAEESAAEENVAEENVAEETVAEESAAEENVAEEDVAEENVPEESAGEESAPDENVDNETVDNETADNETADNENADDQNAEEENAEENADEENADEENADEENADEEYEEENQNCNVLDIAETSNNYDGTSDCCTLNDNTLDNIKASLPIDKLITKRFYSTFL